MNIVYFHSHDTGRVIEPYGYPVSTPRLKQLALDGVLFRNAFSAAPTCSPSRSALLTGMTPHECGMTGLAHLGFGLNDPSRHLAHVLRERGYTTALSGVQHEMEMPRVSELGYEHHLSAVYQETDAAKRDLESARLAASFVEEQPADKPFFLSLGCFSPHRAGRGFPILGEIPDPDYVLPPPLLANLPSTRADMAEYYASVTVVDQALGILIQALEKSGRLEDTVIVYTTDHGIAFPGMKGTLSDAGIGVSLILQVPEKLGVHPGRTSDALVSHLDVFPTLCELADIPKPTWLQGQSLVPILTGQEEQIRDTIFSECNFHVAYEPRRCVRTDRFKLVREYGPDRSPVACNVDDSPSKDVWLAHGYLERELTHEALYDLMLDPLEQVNIVGKPEYKPVYDDLSARLQRWMEATSDPLLIGKVPAPQEAVVRNRRNISPADTDFDDDYVTGRSIEIEE